MCIRDRAKKKGKNTKTLVFKSKYPSEDQAEDARLALIHLANCSHNAPCLLYTSRYRFLNGIFVRQKLEHGMSYLLNNDYSPRLDKNTIHCYRLTSCLVQSWTIVIIQEITHTVLKLLTYKDTI